MCICFQALDYPTEHSGDGRNNLYKKDSEYIFC
jgi:hypothetical protein